MALGSGAVLGSAKNDSRRLGNISLSRAVHLFLARATIPSLLDPGVSLGRCQPALTVFALSRLRCAPPCSAELHAGPKLPVKITVVSAIGLRKSEVTISDSFNPRTTLVPPSYHPRTTLVPPSYAYHPYIALAAMSLDANLKVGVLVMVVDHKRFTYSFGPVPPSIVPPAHTVPPTVPLTVSPITYSFGCIPPPLSHDPSQLFSTPDPFVKLVYGWLCA